jgi:AraC-like DNA-binding protein/CheY-like chemotaxis protein
MKDTLVIDCKGREKFWINLKSNNRILFATTIHDGLNLLSENVSLVFLNLDCSGVEVLRLIKKAYPFIEVIFITSSDTEETCTEAFGEEARSCISKSSSVEDILQKIKALIGAGDITQKQPQPILSDDTHEAEYFINIPSNLVNGVLKVRDYIIQNYSESITLDDACKLASTSKTYFCRCFKCITGHSLRNYHHLVKVQRAEELLRDKRLSIEDVAIKLGYSDPNYFSTVYKRITGISPKQR